MEQIQLTVADGTPMQCFVSFPSTPWKKAIVILQEAFGVNHHIQDLTKRFAAEGYVAIAPELFHRTAKPGQTWGYGEFDQLGAHLAAVTAVGMQQDIQACYNWLTQEKKCTDVAASGYCLGGRAAFVANAVVPLKAAISYYGGRIATHHVELAKNQKAPLLFFWGGLDKHIPSEQIHSLNQALTEAGKDFSCVQFAKADHGFFCDEKPAYHPAASREAWALTLQFLKEHMNS